jgi:exodeoxyribonuclease-5
MMIRENPKAEGYDFESHVDDKLIHTVATVQEVKYAFDALFNSPAFKLDSDFCKVIAWTNKTVGTMNNVIRTLIYGKDKKKIMVGEKLLANSPIIMLKNIVFTTNDEFEVVSIEVKSLKRYDFDIDYYKCRVKQETTYGGAALHKTIHVLHEDGEDVYNNICTILKDQALEAPRGSKEASAAWKNYYSFQQEFANVAYNYAITVHKSQGSTYDRCFVVTSDITRNRNVRERNRLMYTALSRPKNHVVFIE